jgi:hydroxymethylglutaryl-CoA lyase
MKSENRPHIEIIEVGPRDGLQNEKGLASLETKIEFIEDLIVAGVRTIELGSFVREDKVPQMAKTKELYQHFKNRSLSFPCLVPNMKGLELALAAGVKEIALFSAVSETFNLKNINSSIEESFKTYELVAKKALNAGMKIRSYLSCVFGCPYEGEVSLKKTKELSQRFLSMGAYEVSLGDTIGIGKPTQVVTLLEELLKTLLPNQLALHLHDTYGRAIENIQASLPYKIFRFDSSTGGLGGCPYAQGATGNVATEKVIELFDRLGLATGIDRQKIILAGEKLKRAIKVS